MFIQIELGMQILSDFDKRYLEHELVKCGHATDLYGTAGLAWGPSQVLLFELKQCMGNQL